MPNDTVTEQAKEINLSSAIPTMKGYTFKGWAETPNGEVKYRSGEEIIAPRGNQTLYAVWDKN